MNDPKKKSILQGLQDLADKATRSSHDIRRKEGWRSPEEVAATQRVLELIREKTAAPVPGSEADTLRTIHRVVSDLLDT